MAKTKKVKPAAKSDKKAVSDKKAQTSEVTELKQKLSKLRRKLKTIKSEAALPAVSPLAPKKMPKLPRVDGARFATAASGIKYQGRDDVMLAVLAPGTAVAGVFTRSATRSASVLDCEAKIGRDTQADAGAAILVNAGNANAFTGKSGADAVAALTAAVSTATGVPEGRVFTSSTGVIGEALPHEKISATLDQMAADLDPKRLAAAASAIRTTDTFTKIATTTVTLDGQEVRIAGIAKGSGMIAPDMATMLVYLFTDAKIRPKPMQRMLARLTDETFNCITVDGDTSTSDTVLLAATGKSAVPEISDLRSRVAKEFSEALHGVMLDLAHQVVRDGEGATKFVEISVSGATNDNDARKAAMAVANSPLVKTAIAGEDPNWGRVVMALGKSGAHAQRDLISIRFGDILVAENGWVADSYSESDGAKYMKKQDLKISVDLGIGRGVATVWTCDFTHGYIQINADYRS